MPKVDIAKRRRIMQRSMKLGHCICDPRRPCPCDVFKNQGICPCSGERPEPIAAEAVRLTELVHNAGCASKIAPADLETVLSRLPAVDDPAVLCGIPAGDDAGIYRLADGTCIVQTVDVMTPCVDDPQLFGRICAANCLSDIYAMGGVPRSALSILGFPAETLDGQIMYEMMAGAMEVLAEANCALIGGHSIKDEEIKLGFAITGTIDADKAVEHGSLAAGDLLVLTKPLGAGVLNFARQIGRGCAEGLSLAEASMATLNAPAAEAMGEIGVSACTDVTGFGLFGHLIAMARSAEATARIWADALPAFPGALEALADGVVPGAVERNTEYVAADIAVADDVAEARVHLGFDAQTSGGLLIAVAEERHEALLKALAARGVRAETIGKVVGASSGRIEVVDKAGDEAPPTPAEQDELPHAAAAAPGGETDSPCCASAQPAGAEAPAADRAAPCCAEAQQPPDASCCPEAGAAGPASGGASTTPEVMRAFGEMMRLTGADGALDGRTKKLLHFALSVITKCGPCTAGHRESALKMGITPEQLDEAAWCAIAMGGAPVRMFYQETLKQPQGE